MTQGGSIVGSPVRPGGEVAVAAVVFGLALLAYLTANAHGVPVARPLPLALFTLLAGGYVALGVAEVPRRIIEALDRSWLRIFAGPAVLWAACVLYAAAAGLSVADRALAFGTYLAIPAVILATGVGERGKLPWRELAAAVSLGLGVKYHLLPTLPVPAPSGFDASRLVGLVGGLYFFLVARPLEGIGFRWALSMRDVAVAAGFFAAYSAIALPIGFATHFIVWNPRVAVPDVILRPIVVYLVTAVPEEFLFRGLIQNLLTRWLGIPLGLAIGSVIFGLSHLPDPRYAVLATIAGVAYGWVYLRTGKVTASAITHALVDAVWVILLHR